MKALYLLALALYSTSAFADLPAAFRCEMRGEKLFAPELFKDLLLDAGGPREIAFTLSEPTSNGSGTYNTYAHLDVAFAGLSGAPELRLQARAAIGKVKSIEIDRARPLTAQVRFKSRVYGGDIQVVFSCRAFRPAYLFLPTGIANPDPFSGSHFLPTTVGNLLANERNFSANASMSKAEFLGDTFCVSGNAETALREIATTSDLWRRDLKSQLPLAPLSLNVDANGSIRWLQRRQTLECVRSHEEKVVDNDSGEESYVTVCDETKLVEQEPSQAVIRACR